MKINVNEIRRKLNDQAKQQLLDLINQTIEKYNLDKNVPVDVMSQMSDSEALGFGREILSFLKEKNFNVRNEIGQFQRSPIVVGVEIGFNKMRKNIEISVGYRPDSK